MTVVVTPNTVQRVVGAGPERFDAVRTRVEGLARLQEPTLVVPTRVSMMRADDVLVEEPATEGQTLAHLLDSRGFLRAGECVWLGMAIAATLASLHREGLAHGALDANSVLIAEDRVSLTRLVDGAEGAMPADDIAALGVLLAQAVSESDAARIRAWTDPMTHPDAHGRPTAAMIARALASCAPPEALVPRPVGVAAALRRAAKQSDQEGRASVVRLRGSRWWSIRLRLAAGASSVARLGSRSPRTWIAVGLVVAVLTAGGLAAVVLVGHGGGDAPPGIAETTPVGALAVARQGAEAGLTSPAEAARTLTQARFDALSSGDGEALVALTAEGTVARAQAEAMADALASGALKVEGLVGVVESAEVVKGQAIGGQGKAVAATSAVIAVRYRLDPHVVVSDGVETAYDGYVQTVDLTLQWVEGAGWRVSEATSVPEPRTTAETGPSDGTEETVGAATVG